MKKFFISFVLIFALIFNIFAGDNKKAHRELRKEFENFSGLSEMKKKGFDLKKLDKMNSWEEIKKYLQPFFIDENGYPLDQHASIDLIYGKNTKGSIDSIKTDSQMCIEWSDEYGSKNELLEKGYIENENMFYYPLYNGEWHEDGYRIGKKYMGEHGSLIYRKNYSMNSEKALLIGFRNFEKNSLNIENFKEISNSKKEYLILDLSYNSGGSVDNYFALVESIKKMNPKQIFILCSKTTFSVAEGTSCWLFFNTKIKTTIIGCPTWGGWHCAKQSKIIEFEGFNINCSIADNRHYLFFDSWDNSIVPLPKEGIGVTPDIYTDGNTLNSLEVVKYLIEDTELSLPKDYYSACIESGNIRN